MHNGCVTSSIGGAAVYAMYSKAYTPKKVCMLGYPLAYTKIAATIKTSKKNSICTPPPGREFLTKGKKWHL